MKIYPIDVKKTNGPATTVIGPIHKDEHENIKSKINDFKIYINFIT